MPFILLETVKFDTFEECHTLAFADNSKVRNEMRQKYAGKRLSFQSSTCVGKNEFLLNVFEEIRNNA